MQRKIIYIIVFIVTIALVIVDSYIDFNSKKNNNATVLQEELDDTYKSADIKSNLVIKNLQNDDQELVYTYLLKIDNVVGAQLTIYKGIESYIIFAANGEVEITIDSNETLTVVDLPQGSNYSIEQITDVSDKYNTTINKEEKTKYEGTLEEENIVEFNNETLKNEKPIKKNPTTSDKNSSMIIVLIYSAILITIALKLKVKKFE
ncbi:MAG: hypothetical protein ACI4XM_08425 [Candidatus Coprovivens sp.]